MHGRRQGCRDRRPFVRHMWPATRVEAAPPPAKGPASPPPPPARSSLPPLRTTSYPPAPTTPPAAPHKQEAADSPRPPSADSFVKDGREFRVGDCALFQAVAVPPFIGLIRWIEKKEGFPKLRVSWLYRSADVKLNKAIQLNAAPNEIFYSFHQDETSAVSLLHPCKVAFLRKGVELPAGISSFVCRRVYDIDNKCLWWLTDKDYINERQEEVNRLLHRTKLEMHAAVQSGRSPKRLNSPSSAQQKSGSDDAQNCGVSKGKKRERVEQGIDLATRDRDRPLKVEEGELANLKAENMKYAFTKFIAKFTDKDKGGLPHAEAVEKLVQFMQLDRTERKIDLGGRVLLAHIIAATESLDCLGRFVQLRGLPILNEWLQETHKGKSGEGGSPKETDKRVEEFLMALLRALSRLPINLNALQSCSIGKSVNHLRSHKSAEIQKRAKCLVENWKKRVDAEMKSNEAKPVVSGQAVSWSGKGGAAEISNGGNRRSASSEASPKNQVSRTANPGASDAVTKSNPLTSVSSKSQHMQPANVATNSKDPPCKSAGGSESPTVKEEKSSSSSQSLNNSHSCSSDHAKTFGSPWKEDARSSTAASGNASKTSGSSSRVHRRPDSVRLGSGIQKEATVGRSTSLDRSSFQEKSSQSGMASEKGDTPSDNSNSHRLIVRFPNPSRSPARSVSGGSFEDPSVTGSRSSSPVDKHEQNGRRVKMKTENFRPQLASDANAESWHSNEIKGVAGSDEGDKSACPTLESNRTTEEAVKEASAMQAASSSHVNEKVVCSSETKGNPFSPMNALIEIKYSDTGPSLQAGDDTAMNLLASVAGEISKSELISPSTSPRNSSANEVGCEGDSIEKIKVECDTVPSQCQGSSDVQKVIAVKQEKADTCLIAKEERNQRAHLSLRNNKCMTSTGLPLQNGTDCNAVESSAKTEKEDCTKKSFPVPGVDSQGEDHNACASRGPVEDGRISSADVVSTTLGGQCNSTVSNRKPELLPPEQLQLCAPDKQAHALLKHTDQKPLAGVLDQSEATDTCEGSTGSKLDLKSSVCPVAVDPQKVEVLGTINTALKEDEKEQPSSTSADVNKLVVLPVDVPNGIKESKDSSSESSSQVKLQAVISQDTEHSARHSPKKPSNDVGRQEDLVTSDEGSSIADKPKSNGTAKLDFDLNELGDEGNHSEPATSPVICSSTIHLSGLSPFVSPVLSGLPAPITVAAPAKGPFVPPENLLRVKPEAGWKGSAATSAFRPAEPRKVVGTSLTAPDAAGKQSRPAFDIDLNVADDQILEEDISQSSAQTIGSCNTRSRDGPVRSAGIELDLNRADEVAENNQFISNSSHRVEVTLLPARSLPGGLPSTDMNSSKNFFDLNNGPSLDEASTEPAQRSLSSKGASSIPFLPQVAGLRMNGTEFNNMAPWFASANPYAPVVMQPFLPARGEQSYPIETASGTQRMIASAADGSQFGNDPGRAPVISTPPTMVFHPPPAYQYPGFPFAPSVHLQTTGFPIGSTSYANSAPSGVPYFPTMAPSLVGSTGALPAQHARQYAINRPKPSSSDGHDSNWKWKKQGFDLNSGPGSVDLEGKDERVPLSVRQNLMTAPQAFVEEQTRMYQLPGVGIKRKEPEGSWDAERSSYKQLSWK